MNETYVVEFLHLGDKHAPTVIDCAASPDHDLETAKAHALETFRQAQKAGWGGPLVDAFRILDEKHTVLFTWTLTEEKQFQEAEVQHRREMTKALNLSHGLTD
jgi:exonuclease III